MKFSSENHSGDVNNHSGQTGFFIHFSPESLFTSRRNHYSHHSGTIIHMPRNPQLGPSPKPVCRQNVVMRWNQQLDMVRILNLHESAMVSACRSRKLDLNAFSGKTCRG